MLHQGCAYDALPLTTIINTLDTWTPGQGRVVRSLLTLHKAPGTREEDRVCLFKLHSQHVNSA